MACLSACPAAAIQKDLDAEGFWRPKIDAKKCISCGKCTETCPEITAISKHDAAPTVFACWSVDKALRKESSSGGFFGELSRKIVKQGGVVIGAALMEDWSVAHISVRKEDELRRLRGSKYVQSITTGVFEQAKILLNNGIEVLFSGTPCQVAGLYRFLKKDYENLLTVDLVCHGVPSPKVYGDYIKYLEQKHDSQVVEMNFRDKTISWTYYTLVADFANGARYKGTYCSDPYLVGFLTNMFLRPCCHDCLYADSKRISDITIGDFWGYTSRSRTDRDNDSGISLVLANTRKGKSCFENVSNRLTVFKRPLAEAIRGNRCLSHSFPMPLKRAEFWADYFKMSFDQLAKKYMRISRPTLTQLVRCRFRYRTAKVILFPHKVLRKLWKLCHEKAVRSNVHEKSQHDHGDSRPSAL